MSVNILFKFRENFVITKLPISFDHFDNFKTGHLRDFVKRVRRLRSNVIHEFLDQAEIDAMISQLAQESMDDRKSWGKKSASKAKTKKSVSSRPKKKSATGGTRAKSAAVKKKSTKKKASPKKKR